jgi:hypothetical protein
MTHSAVAKPISNSTMQLARTSSGVRPVNLIRHNLVEPETDHYEAPVTIDSLKGFIALPDAVQRLCAIQARNRIAAWSFSDR